MLPLGRRCRGEASCGMEGGTQRRVAPHELYQKISPATVGTASESRKSHWRRLKVPPASWASVPLPELGISIIMPCFSAVSPSQVINEYCSCRGDRVHFYLDISSTFFNGLPKIICLFFQYIVQ